jgi:predicted ribosomally synthesized peptide with nif11-like leader
LSHHHGRGILIDVTTGNPMSEENLDQFVQQITDSEELQTRIGEEMDTDAFIALGAEHGCEFSTDDLTAGAELSDEELDGVAGG